MTKFEGIKKKIKELEPLLKERFEVKRIGIFGSYIKREEKRGSDLDILVEFSEPISLFKFIELEEFLSKKLGVKVDLVTKKALKPLKKNRIIKEAVYV